MNAKKPAPKKRKTPKTTKAIVAQPTVATEQTEAPVATPKQEAAIPAKPADIVCKKCSGVNSASASLCRKCGSKLAVATPSAAVSRQPAAPVAIPPREAVTPAKSAGIVCKKCGGVNPADASVCRKCGSRLAVAPPAVVSHQEASSPCGKCGHQNQVGANFCARCGAKIEAVSRSRFCPRCGDPVAGDERFCDKCGKKLT